MNEPKKKYEPLKPDPRFDVGPEILVAGPRIVCVGCGNPTSAFAPLCGQCSDTLDRIYP